LQAISDAKLLEDMAHMRFRRAWRDNETPSNVMVTQPSGE
jgi:hypothetical protein